MRTASHNDKEARLNIRVNRSQKEMLHRAAKAKHTSVSNFILENACEAAYEVLASEQHFRLPVRQWEDFCNALDAPVRDIPSLRKLLTGPGVFDAPQ